MVWPVWSSVDLFAVVVASVAFVGLWRFRWKVVPVIAASAAAGLVGEGTVRLVAAPLRRAGADVEPDVVDHGRGHPDATSCANALRGLVHPLHVVAEADRLEVGLQILFGTGVGSS